MSNIEQFDKSNNVTELSATKISKSKIIIVEISQTKKIAIRISKILDKKFVIQK